MAGQIWKNRKNVYLSPYVEEPLNSKVIKSFVLELRSRKCFRVSRFLCSMYICYEHSNVRFTHSRIWLWYKCILMLNWIVWLNWIAWNRNVFDNETVRTSKVRAYAKLKPNLHLDCVLMLNWIIWNWTDFWHWNCIYTKLNC